MQFLSSSEQLTRISQCLLPRRECLDGQPEHRHDAVHRLVLPSHRAASCKENKMVSKMYPEGWIIVIIMVHPFDSSLSKALILSLLSLSLSLSELSFGLFRRTVGAHNTSSC